MNQKLFAFIMTLGLAVTVFNEAGAATIVGAAKQSGDFKTLLMAGTAAGVDKALDSKGPYSLFAPNDQAFAKVPKAKLDDLMKPANLNKLKTALGAHLVTGILSMKAIEAGLTSNDAVVVMTVNNMPLIFKREGGGLTVNGAKVQAPITVDNGLVYTIDTVLLPPMPLQPTY